MGGGRSGFRWLRSSNGKSANGSPNAGLPERAPSRGIRSDPRPSLGLSDPRAGSGAPRRPWYRKAFAMLKAWPSFNELAKSFADGEVCRVAGLTGAARALVIAELLAAAPRAALVVASSVTEAHRFALDLKFFGANAVEFPEPEPRLWR